MRIDLVNMPFADLNRPSFALSQLAALARREFGTSLDIEVHYLNYDFENYFGPDMYAAINGQLDHLLTGAGEWLFRGTAFPSTPDNAQQYFERYYNGSRWTEFRRQLALLREGLPGFCSALIEDHGLDRGDIVGFTSMFAQNMASIAMARLIKERSPLTLTVLGGANCEAPMGTVIAKRVPAINAVFSGPALVTFPEFIRRVMSNRAEEIHQIPGVITARNAGDPRYANAVGRDQDIDDFFEPDYDSFKREFSGWRDSDVSNSATKPVLLFETSRGCWWGQRSHCTFCGLNGLGMEFRSMNSDMARRQFNWLFDFAPWCSDFSCTDNIMPKSYPQEVFPELNPPTDSTIFYEIKLPISERDLNAMKRAGVRRVQPGIEALATETLKLMGKGTSAFLNLQFLKACTRLGMLPVWNLLMGFPGEREEVYEKYAQDIPLLTHLPPPSGAVMVRFDRFSPYHARAEDYGLSLRPLDFYELSYPFPPDEIEDLAYFFADQNYSPYMLNAINWLKPISGLIGAWRSAWEGPDRPQLTLQRDTDGSYWINDTRGPQPLRLEPSADDLRILRRLASPLREDRLVSDLGLTAAALARRVDLLRSRRLLFEENGRLLSLVVSEEETLAADGPGYGNAPERALAVVSENG